jgi:hypothetical protein
LRLQLFWTSGHINQLVPVPWQRIHNVRDTVIKSFYVGILEADIAIAARIVSLEVQALDDGTNV